MTSSRSVDDELFMQQRARFARTLRTEAGLTLAELAGAADVSVGLISQIERGPGNPSYNTRIKLAHALGVKVGEFLSAPRSRPGGATTQG